MREHAHGTCEVSDPDVRVHAGHTGAHTSADDADAVAQVSETRQQQKGPTSSILAVSREYLCIMKLVSRSSDGLMT